MLLNIVLIPGKPTPKSNFRDGALCELWYCCSLCPIGDVCQVPLAAVRHGRRRHCRIVEGSFGYPGSRGQYSGKFRFIEKRGVQDEVVAMLLNIVMTPSKPTPKSNFRDGT